MEETDEVVLPDVTACRLWLLNRRPGQWRDKQEVEHSGDLTISLRAVDMGVPDE